MREDYFPFTHPSWEVEVKYLDAWLEVLGCGVIHPEVLANAGIHGRTGWAFGVGLDRIAMKLFSIPDIRLLWSDDPRFTEQWKDGKVRPFKPYSKEPPCHKDICFWVGEDYEERNMLDVVRNLGGNLVESVKLIDEFYKEGRRSKAYRITYRSWDKTLTNEEVNIIQGKIRWEVATRLGVVLR